MCLPAPFLKRRCVLGDVFAEGEVPDAIAIKSAGIPENSRRNFQTTNFIVYEAMRSLRRTGSKRSMGKRGSRTPEACKPPVARWP